MAMKPQLQAGHGPADNDSDYEALMQRLHISGTSNNNMLPHNSFTVMEPHRALSPLDHTESDIYNRQQYKLAASKSVSVMHNDISMYPMRQQLPYQYHQQPPFLNIPEDYKYHDIYSSDHGSDAYLKHHSPVYENLDFYHQTIGCNIDDASSDQYEMAGSIPQSQTPAANSIKMKVKQQNDLYMTIMANQTTNSNSNSNSNSPYASYTSASHNSSAAIPIYENMRIVPNSGQRIQPQASPATATIYQQQAIDSLPSPSLHPSRTAPNTIAGEHSPATSALNINTNINLLASPIHRRSISNSSLKSANSSISGTYETNSPNHNYRLANLGANATNTAISPAKSYNSNSGSNCTPGTTSTTNDYKLLQHTPLKNSVSLSPFILFIAQHLIFK